MGFEYKDLVFCRNNGWFKENMDKRLTVPKWLLINWPKIPQIPQNLLPKINEGAGRVWEITPNQYTHGEGGILLGRSKKFEKKKYKIPRLLERWELAT